MSRARRAAAAASLAAAWLAAGGAAAWAKLPDWARPIAQSAEPAPEGVPEHPAQVLLSEMRYTIQPDGSVRVRRRFAVQALGADTREVGIGWFGFDDTAKMTTTRAWHLPPGDRARKSWLPPADIAAGGSFLGDYKVRGMAVPGVRKGSLVFYEFEAVDRPRFLSLSHLFYEGAPVTLASFQVETPPGWTVRWAWPRRPGPEPVASGQVWTWEMRDLDDPVEEPLGAAPEEQSPLLVVGASPGEGSPFPIPSFPTWRSFSEWYEGLAEGREAPTPEVKAAAERAREGAGDGLFDTIRAAGRFVRDRVRYVAVELGIGGWQPHPAAETLAHLYGDCKDKGTLFRAMLAASNVASYPVLVNFRFGATVSETVPGNGFDHFVVAVPVPDDVAIPGDAAPAILEAGDLGRLLIVDTTDDRVSIGSISGELAGRPALLVAGPRGRLVTLPGRVPAAHRIERRITATLAADRALALERASSYAGAFAAAARSEYRRSSVEWRKKVERRILQLWPDAVPADGTVRDETPEGLFHETISARRGPLPSSGPDAKVPLFPGAGDDVERVALGKRKTAVEYRHPMKVRYEVRYEGVPEGAALPARQSLAGEGWSVLLEASRDGDAVSASWEVTLSRTRFEPEAFAELRRFWSAVTTTGGAMISLGL